MRPAVCCPWPTAHTGELIQWACQALARIWKPDHLYRRCGVLLTDLAPETQQQTSLFASQFYDPRKQTLMRTVDRCRHLLIILQRMCRGWEKTWYGDR